MDFVVHYALVCFRFDYSLGQGVFGEFLRLNVVGIPDIATFACWIVDAERLIFVIRMRGCQDIRRIAKRVYVWQLELATVVVAPLQVL